jgi:predicted MFS family arabinose efflux permease
VLTTYRRVLALPGAAAFSSAGLLARLPISMVSLGIVLLVSGRTGSYAFAGAVSASYLVGGAAFAVLQARLVDRRGQSAVLPWGAGLFAVGIGLVVAGVEAGWPTPLPQLCAALAGAALPQVGACVRARWSRLVPDKTLLQTAFALEAVVDETVFVVGPTLVTFLATSVHPLAGLGAAVLAAVTGTLLLVVQRATEPPAHPRGRGPARHRGSLHWRVLGPLTVCAAGLGVLFGGTEVAVVAFTDHLGVRPLSGLLLAIWAAGSLLAGAVTGALRLRARPATRFRWFVLLLALLMTPLPFVDGVGTLGVLMFLAGLAIAPTLIASVAWVEESVPHTRLTEGISVFSTGLAVGVAPGAALVGWVVDRAGASAGFWVPAVAGLGAAALAWLSAALPGGRPGDRHGDRPGAPVSPPASSPSGSSS